MERYVKFVASPEFVSAVQQIEDRADECYRSLPILDVSVNLGAWAVLTVIVRRIERVIAEKGYSSPAHTAAMFNLSRAGAQAISWLKKSRSQSFAARRSLKTDDRLLAAAEQAVSVAHGYDAFTSSFPLWHKNILEAQLLEPSVVRFTALGGENDRRVRAYQQGLRPAGSRPKPGSSLQFASDLEEQVKQKILNLVRSGSSADGPLSFSYGKPKRLWRTVYQT